MHRRKMTESFNYSIEGFMYVLKSQKNMRLHFLLAVIALLLGIYFNFTKLEFMILVLTITFVFLAEMINTSMEFVIDLITPEIHPLARIVKDISAGAVLVAAVNSIFIGYLLFLAHLPTKTFQTTLDYIRHQPLHITFISLLLVVAVVIFSKAKLGRGRPLRGGMPSGHAALSFSMLTICLFITQSRLIIAIVFMLALLVSASRIRQNYHTAKEVFVGALLGTSLTSLTFFILRY
ncbi:MAG: diacylglycerol kinase [Candidatus Omnitrophica bacterium]|nr:diacylglycerol kinase [Candidatus Omnitrophota bacterium]MBU1925950.1 diacylglycerol kinase [Candidatus Omnitrophota bacterium]